MQLDLKELEERLQKMTAVREDGCWMFLGWYNSGGYGALTYHGVRLLAHRASYMVYKGSIPEGLYVLHTCDNRWCINPDHLWLGTYKDNTSDMITKARDSLIGERSAQAKLKEQDVIEIRRLLMEGNLSYTKIGNLYGVSHTTIYDIKRRKCWGHVT